MRLAVDTETTGLEYWNGHYPFVITACDEQGRTFFARLKPGQDASDEARDGSLPAVWPEQGPSPADLEWDVKNEIPGCDTIAEFRNVLAEASLVMHNAKFDVPMLEYAGFNLYKDDLADTMILARLIFSDAMRVNLKTLARWLLKVDYDSEVRLKQWMRANHVTKFYHVPADILQKYAIDDAVYTMALYRGLITKLPDEMQKLWRQEMDLVDLVIRMEERGMLCDIEYAKEQARWCRQHQQECQQYVDDINGAPINLNSTQQLQSLLFEKLKLHEHISREDLHRYREILMTPSGLHSTKREALKVYDHPVIERIMEFRMFGKMAGTYFEKFVELADKNNVIHPSFWQSGPRTGRFSGSNPSFQTIPSVTSGRLLDFQRDHIPDVRRCFGPRPGFNMYAPDFSQIELRLMAWYAQDERMMEAFINKEDIHDNTTKAIFPDDWQSPDDPSKIDKPKRTFCKMVNFGVSYGMGIGKLSSDLGVPVERGKAFISRYFATYPGVHALMRDCQRSIVTKGYVESVFGRRTKADPRTAYKGLNYLIQGTAADIMKAVMLRVDRLFLRLGLEAYILNTIHDELIFEIRQEDDTDDFHFALQNVMQNWPEFDPIPLTVNCKKVIDYWGHHEEVW